MITIVSKWYLGWTTVENAILFVASGSGAVFSYVIMTIVVTKKWMDDRQVLLYGIVTALLNLLSIGMIASLVEFKSSLRVFTWHL